MARVSTRSPRTIAAGSGRVSPVTFLQETFSELRKSVWPSREETARLTVVVIVLSAVAAVFLGGLDQILDRSFVRYIL